MRLVKINFAVTEKSYKLLDQGIYSFDVVDKTITKDELKRFLKQVLNVDVVKIRSVLVKGKRKSDWRTRKVYARKDKKRFYIELKEGQKIDVSKFKKGGRS